ncbi:hypothetical protein Tco_1519838 [Tanacetum coccineum]
MAMMRAAAPSTYILTPRSETLPSGTLPLLPISLPTSSPPLFLPSTDRRADVLEVTLPPRNSVLDLRRDLDKEIGYGITDTWDEMVEDMQGTPAATDVAKLGQRMTDFITTIRHDTYEIYGRLDDAQDDRLLMSGQLNLLRTDRRSHARTARLMENEARASHEAWVQSMDASDMARSKVSALRTTVLAQQIEIRDLRAMVALRSQQRPGRDPAHPDVPEEADTTTTTTTTPVTDEQLKTLIAQGVDDVLAERDATRSRNGEDNHDSGTGIRRQAHLSRECTYPDIMKCKPLYFKGTEGVVELTQWFERMETMFRISNCTVENQIKFATCTLFGNALMW